MQEDAIIEFVTIDSNVNVNQCLKKIKKCKYILTSFVYLFIFWM